tara:strand:+ start:226 stop:735 length:510 start_codon:yes stop_codon:yes gene_type:complete
MSNFTPTTFLKHDDYMTPKYVWEDIKQYIPQDKEIWECFYGDGKSGQYLTELGFNVIHENIDFFENNKGEVLVSNPPFSKTKQIMERLVEIGKPFIMLMSSSKINTQYCRRIFKDLDDKLQIIIPKARIGFEKQVNGKVPDGWKYNKPNFDTFYYCWKMNLPRDIVWLD